MIRILFKREDCIGCGNCVDISPFYWKMETLDGLAVLIGAKKQGNYYVLEAEEEALEENREAEKLCPVHVIKIKD